MRNLFCEIQKCSTTAVVCFVFFAMTLSILGLGTAQAQQTQTEALAPSATNSASSPLPQDPATSEDGLDNSFADMALLGQQISIAQRKIQAMTLKNSLDALEAQQTMGTFPFKVLRIEGFGNTLYAVLSDETGIIYQVGPGDIIGSQYRVSLIRPYSVGVVDITTRKAYAVPFVIGSIGDDQQANDMSSDSAAASSPAPVPISTPVSAGSKL